MLLTLQAAKKNNYRSLSLSIHRFIEIKAINYSSVLYVTSDTPRVQ